MIIDREYKDYDRRTVSKQVNYLIWEKGTSPSVTAEKREKIKHRYKQYIQIHTMWRSI